MGRLDRMVGLSSLVGRATTSWVTGRVRHAFGGPEPDLGASAKDVARTLSQLKGVALKAGQQLAQLAVHLDLPDDVRDALATLHAQAEPAPFPVIRRVVEAELGRPLSEVFAEWSEVPLGAASLAQAHAARLHDGREVVFKVLHEGVAEAVESDLLALRTLLRTGRVLTTRSAAELDDVVSEIEERLREELDYLQEAANVTAFHERFGRDPRFVVPAYVPELSGERVLVLDRVPGLPIDAFLATADRATRQRAGENLGEWFFTGTFHHHLLHADPHPGNYLFLPDGRVGVVDFGCVKRFEPSFLARYASTVLAALDGDRDGALEGCHDLGVWDGTDAAAGEAIWGFCEALVDPWRRGPTTIGGDEVDLVVRLRPAAERLWGFRSVRGARDMVFLHRALAGMYALARRLEVRRDYGELLRRHLGVAVRSAA